MNAKVNQTTVKNIKRLYLLMNKQIEKELKKYNLARSQFQVIYYTHQGGEISQKELVKLMQVEPATLTVIIDGLVKKGILKRKENKDDKRSNVIELTAIGDQVRKKIPSIGEILERQMFQKVSKTDITITTKTIERMIHNLEPVEE